MMPRIQQFIYSSLLIYSLLINFLQSTFALILKMLSDIIEEELNCQLKKKHSSKVDLLCEQCQKHFYKLSYFTRHIKQKHQNQRSYLCTFEGCTKTFKRDNHLKRHMISHTHQKNFKCKECIMAFGYKHHLDRHVKVIHNNQLHECKECDQKYVKKKALSRHYEKVHGHNQQKSNNQTQSSSKKKIKKAKKMKINSQNKSQSIEQKVSNNLQIEEKSQNQQDASIFEQEEESNSKQNNCNLVQKQQNDQKFCSQKTQKQNYYRCIYIECPLAFKHKHELKRHLERANHSDLTLAVVQQQLDNQSKSKNNQQKNQHKSCQVNDIMVNAEKQIQ